jgi:hypothetical protein
VRIYGPELDKLLSGPSETHEQIRIKGQDRFLYRAVDSTGQTIEFRKSAYGWPEGIYLAIVDESSCLSRNIRGAAHVGLFVRSLTELISCQRKVSCRVPLRGLISDCLSEGRISYYWLPRLEA